MRIWTDSAKDKDYWRDLMKLALASLKLVQTTTQVERRKKHFKNRLALLMMLHSQRETYRDSILTDFIEWDDGEVWKVKVILIPNRKIPIGVLKHKI